MNPQQYLELIKTFQKNVLDYMDSMYNVEECYQNILYFFNSQNTRNNPNQLKLLLHLLVKISNNHHRGPNFFYKIEKILELFKVEINKYFTNSEIFRIFKNNKRILLFLIEEKILTLDPTIVNKMTEEKFRTAKYHLYFYNEIKPHVHKKLSEELFKDIDGLPDDFENKRRLGENENYICELIRKDSLNEFVTYVERTKFPLRTIVLPSAFETNAFLMNNEPSFLEYAAFFGSIKIFKFLKANNIEMTSKLWLYAMHGRSFEIINILQASNIKPEDQTYAECLKESIKCHHGEVTNQMMNFLLKNQESSWNSFLQCLKNYNFAFIQNGFINQSTFYVLCKYDYIPLVDLLLKTTNIDINGYTIQKRKMFFLMKFKIVLRDHYQILC